MNGEVTLIEALPAVIIGFVIPMLAIFGGLAAVLLWDWLSPLRRQKHRRSVAEGSGSGEEDGDRTE